LFTDKSPFENPPKVKERVQWVKPHRLERAGVNPETLEILSPPLWDATLMRLDTEDYVKKRDAVEGKTKANGINPQTVPSEYEPIPFDEIPSHRGLATHRQVTVLPPGSIGAALKANDHHSRDESSQSRDPRLSFGSWQL
jgi:hypothetical protein